MVRPITLVQPRHSYAPPPSVERFGDRVLPNTLLHVRARLMEAGVTTHFIDHNIEPERQPETDVVGLTVLGMPYIPIVRSMAMKLLGEGHQVVIGGQTVEGLVKRDYETNAVIDRGEFDAFFDPKATIGNDWGALAKTLNIDQEALVGSEPNGSMEKWKSTSLVPAYEALSEEELRFYLNGLVPFEIAQGCKEKCTFCAAAKNRQEAYRDSSVIETDLAYLIKRAENLGVDALNLYITNLDLFQTPGKLAEFSQSVLNVLQERRSVHLKLRGLCTVEGFHTLHKTKPWILHTMRAIGLERIGAGVDGWSYDVWKKVGKHNDETQCIEFVQECGTQYNITPETLMVYGHESDTAKTMADGNDFMRWAHEHYGATPRPHCSKDLIPGSMDWKKAVRRNDSRIQMLHDHPEYCQAFDFCAAPSSLTHPTLARQEMIDRYFREGCAIGGTLTQLIEPMDPTLSLEENIERMLKNLRRYDV